MNQSNKNKIFTEHNVAAVYCRLLGNDQTIASLVDDILDHYENNRENLLTGKAMIVAYSRAIAMKIYDRIMQVRPGWTDKVAVVMTESNKDPEEWRKVIGNKHHRDELAKVFKDNDSPMKIAIVVDMWLTGFDVPSLATMYSRTVMKEAQVAAMEEFIDNVRVLINALGYKVLEPTVQKSSSSTEDNEKLYLNTGAVKAVGIVTTEGFVLLAGSKINEKASEKSLNKGAIALRKKHFAAGKVKDLTTTEDILFSSSSAAADFATGYSVSGPASWKTASGITLKEIESK